MNNERTIVLNNIATQPIGLKDTQGRTYRLGVGAKVRISEVSLQDILDYPASRIIFNEGMANITNVTKETLYKMGLTEDEINKFAPEAITEAQPEEIEEIVEEKEEEIKEEEPNAATVKKSTTTAKKTTAKRTTTKKTTAKK